jgi:hypothetical protein
VPPPGSKDRGPLSPLGEADLQTLASLLAALGVGDKPAASLDSAVM